MLPSTIAEFQKELEEILMTMDVPEKRKQDVFWLSRNLPIRNGQHSKLVRAMQLCKEIFIAQIDSRD